MFLLSDAVFISGLFVVVFFMQNIIFGVNVRPDIPVSHDVCLIVLLFIADENNSDNHKSCRMPFLFCL